MPTNAKASVVRQKIEIGNFDTNQNTQGPKKAGHVSKISKFKRML